MPADASGQTFSKCANKELVLVADSQPTPVSTFSSSRVGRAAIFAAYATAFLSSLCILVIELVAGRVIARYLGQSLYTWTSIIGVILAGIALGNYVGGRLVDRFSAVKTLAVLLFCGAVASLAIPLVNRFTGESEMLARLDWPPRIAFHVTITFLLPGAVLGTIGPVVAKYALDQGRAVGRTVGNVYAWGAFGSIVGTFLTGFYLIAVMGVRAILFSVAGMLLAMSALYAIPVFLRAAKHERHAPATPDA